MKQHQEMVSNIRRGDRILTAGGLIGVIHKVANNEELIIELEEGVRVRLVKTAVSQILSKTEPVVKGSKSDAPKDEGEEEQEESASEETKTDKKASPRRKTTKN
jgi:preprotein translocase subunit YajC